MADETKKILNRLKRSEGQLRGIQKMISDGAECRDVVTQLSAVRSSIDRAIGIIVAENLVSCLSDDALSEVEKDQKIQDAVSLIVKSK
ncbi:metal-sensitive transcriptional regulator [Vagococcus acidifermentans]|uniref:Cytoplasmic protein n=1 Tax=Vagococcus acidifermentans TaxID=564710 RepID=A0A430B128_9ENTE|nr:metal-sensitive transcriptional regulator [Vagococcus acidifermentans]RSU13922.1 hypothetical protein CBF27_03200 [Vagococcus acidifermentans]